MPQGDNRRIFLEVVTVRDSLSNETLPVTQRRGVILGRGGGEVERGYDK